MIDWTKLITKKQKDQEKREQTISFLTNIVQNILDRKARELNYDNILSLCSYFGSRNIKFKTEAEAGIIWRDLVWEKCYQILYEVDNGLREIPTEEELISELPKFVL